MQGRRAPRVGGDEPDVGHVEAGRPAEKFGHVCVERVADGARLVLRELGGAELSVSACTLQVFVLMRCISSTAAIRVRVTP